MTLSLFLLENDEIKWYAESALFEYQNKIERKTC